MSDDYTWILFLLDDTWVFVLPCRSQVLFPFFLLNQLIDHFTDVWVVAWALNKSETGGGFLVSKKNVILLRWESETKIWFYQLS